MPLTTAGIATQILSSINTLKHHKSCTINDCKVVVNHLIRKFSEPLGKAGRAQVKVSKAVSASGGGNSIKDHAVPVLVLMEVMLGWSNEQLKITDENIKAVEKFLSESLLVVEITPEEDLLLCNNKLQRSMPPGWQDEGHQYFRDPLARYKHCQIEIE